MGIHLRRKLPSKAMRVKLAEWRRREVDTRDRALDRLRAKVASRRALAGLSARVPTPRPIWTGNERALEN